MDCFVIRFVREEVQETEFARLFGQRMSRLLLMATSLEELFGLERKLEMEEHKLQLWGAGVPLNSWTGNGFLYDAENNVGCVVDWLLEPSVAGGWESGRRLSAFLEAGIEEKNIRRRPRGVEIQ